MLPHERAQLYLDDDLLEGNIAGEIHIYSTGNHAEAYIQEKLKISQQDLCLIEWKALERSQGIMSNDKQHDSNLHTDGQQQLVVTILCTSKIASAHNTGMWGSTCMFVHANRN